MRRFKSCNKSVGEVRVVYLVVLWYSGSDTDGDASAGQAVQ